MLFGNFEKVKRRDLVFILILTLIMAAVLFTPADWYLKGHGEGKGFANKNTVRVRGTVDRVDNSDVDQFGLVRTGDQDVFATVNSGKYKGEKIEADNILMGKLELDKVFAPGDQALFTLTINPATGGIIDAMAVDFYRVKTETILFGLFILLLVLIAGWTGTKALVSFVFTGVMIIKIMLPSFLAGWNPILVSFIVVSILTFVIIFLIGGLNLRGLVAFFGCMTGVGITAVLAIVFGHFMRIHGAVRPFSETLLYSGYGHLDITAIFISGIFLASSGAIMDIGMDIAASMQEIKEKKPDISSYELFRSGMTVGRAIIGTMTTTLLLAYSGSYTTLLMVFLAQGTPGINILNLTYVSAEILHTLVGSFGLVLVPPVTALIGSFIYNRQWIAKFLVQKQNLNFKITSLTNKPEPVAIECTGKNTD